MKRVMMAIFLFGITSCAVETTPSGDDGLQPNRADSGGAWQHYPNDDPHGLFNATQPTPSDPQVSLKFPNDDPHAIDCTDGICETLTQCRADGGVSLGACVIRGTICCAI